MNDDFHIGACYKNKDSGEYYVKIKEVDGSSFFYKISDRPSYKPVDLAEGVVEFISYFPTLLHIKLVENKYKKTFDATYFESWKYKRSGQSRVPGRIADYFRKMKYNGYYPSKKALYFDSNQCLIIPNTLNFPIEGGHFFVIETGIYIPKNTKRSKDAMASAVADNIDEMEKIIALKLEKLEKEKNKLKQILDGKDLTKIRI